MLDDLNVAAFAFFQTDVSFAGSVASAKKDAIALRPTRVYTRNMEDQCICTTLRQAAAHSTAYYDAALAPSGIKVTMFRLLRRIEAAKSISITELAVLVGLDRSTLGRNLRVLERQSLVQIGTGDDGRARRVSLTRSGAAKLQEALPLWRQAQRAFSQIVDADVLAVLGRVIDQSGEQVQATGGSA